MNQIEYYYRSNQLENWAELDCENIDIDSLEDQLSSKLEEQMAELSDLEIEHEKIGNPESIGEMVERVVWEQVSNQIGVNIGEDFIQKNHGKNLDLRDDAHIQTTENFKNGKIATHNDKIDYQERYDDWQSNFQHDENGNVVTHQTRAGKVEATLVNGAREPFDKGRPQGSAERGTDIDHTISAGEIIRDPAANAHLTKEEQIAFANSEANLNEMDAAQNRSQGDLPTNDWLDAPNKNGQKPNEIFDISEKQEKQYREKDAEARAELDKQINEGEQRSRETGRQSQKEEALRIGGSAIKSVIMGMLASLLKDIVSKLIEWLRSSNKKLRTFIDSVKEAIHSFINNLKTHLRNAGNTLVSTIATAIFGPVIGMIKKVWLFLKEGFRTIKKAIKFLRDPKNKSMSFSVKMLEVGKIVIGGLTVVGTIVLSEIIEKGLMAIPVFATPIPVLGSLASIVGLFLGALVSGLVGAFALNIIDKFVAKRLKRENEEKQFDKRNEILQTQGKLIVVSAVKVAETKRQVATNIAQRHSDAVAQYNDMHISANQAMEDAEMLHNETVGLHNESDDLHNSISNANEEVNNLLKKL